MEKGLLTSDAQKGNLSWPMRSCSRPSILLPCSDVSHQALDFEKIKALRSRLSITNYLRALGEFMLRNRELKSSQRHFTSCLT